MADKLGMTATAHTVAPRLRDNNLKIRNLRKNPLITKRHVMQRLQFVRETENERERPRN